MNFGIFIPIANGMVRIIDAKFTSAVILTTTTNVGAIAGQT